MKTLLYRASSAPASLFGRTVCAVFLSGAPLRHPASEALDLYPDHLVSIDAESVEHNGSVPLLATLLHAQVGGAGRIGVARETKPKEDPAVYARAILAASVPIVRTIAERYLRQHRGISGALPEQLRFCRNLWHKDAKTSFPALVVPSFWPDGELAQVQAVFLDRETGAKASLPDGCKPKLRFGKGALHNPAIFLRKKPSQRWDVFCSKGQRAATSLRC